MQQHSLRDLVRMYCHDADHSLQELAHSLALHPKVLSRKLNHRAGATLTQSEFKRIIKTLATWTAITTRAQVRELLVVGHFAPASISPEDWATAPLNALDDTLAAASGPSATVPAPVSAPREAPQPHNLPAPLTRLIGREWAVEHVRALLHQSDVRLLTLVGTGGTGKTRLALHVVNHMLDTYPDGVYFVALAGVTDPAQVVPAIARTLTLTDVPGITMLDRLTAFLRDKQLLLVLDNFEQVLDAAGSVGELLHTAPTLKVMVTSRAVLRIDGERAWSVPPLDLPDLQLLPSAAEQVVAYAAVQLFVERAQATMPTIDLTKDALRAAAEICVRLDGLPLAIELAAARSKLLPPQDILARLERRFDVLTGGPRTHPARHQTLRAAIAWSYELLSDGEQQLFRHLAIFVDGWTVAAAEAVCATAELEPPVLDALESLLDKSMIQRVIHENGALRLTMLETIRAYALEQLEAHTRVAELGERHAAYFLQLAEEAVPKLQGAEQHAWALRLEGEHANLRAALSWMLAAQRPDLGFRLATALWYFWWTRGYWSEGRTWLMSLAEQAPAHPACGQALARAGYFARWQGDVAGATTLCASGLELCQAHEDRWGCAFARLALGGLAADRSDRMPAAVLLEESLRGFQAVGDTFWAAWTQFELGWVLPDQRRQLTEESWRSFQALGANDRVAGTLVGLALLAQRDGDLARATVLFNDSIALGRASENRDAVAWALFNLGYVTFTCADLTHAAAMYRESIALYRGMGNRAGTAGALAELGWVALSQGALDQATACFTESLALLHEGGIRGSGLSRSHCGLGWVALLQESVSEALQCFAHSAACFAEVKNYHFRAECVEGVAVIMALHGRAPADMVHAARLLGAAEAMREAFEGPERGPRLSQLYSRARYAISSGLGEDACADIWSVGRTLTAQQAVECVLAMVAHAPSLPPSVQLTIATLTRIRKHAIADHTHGAGHAG